MLSQRIPKSEQHFFLQKLYSKGWKKVDNEVITGGNIVTLSRINKERTETLHVRYMDNGWVRVY